MKLSWIKFDITNIKDAVVFENESMAKHTSFKCGGNAAFLCIPKTVDAVRQIINLCKKEDVEYFIMGNGSNLLVKDEGYEGVIIKLAGAFDTLNCEEDIIEVGSGVMLSKLSKYAANNSLSGLEFAEGIPGTVGGAIYMNAGAYDGEIKDVLFSCCCLDANGEILELTQNQLDLGYRKSILQSNMLIALSAKFKLNKANMEDIKAKMSDFSHRRKTKQPLEMPSAGSTFKRPEGYFAGKLIEDCGLRGYSIGGAQVSDKHCGFIVNKGNATAQDVLDLVEFVQKTVNAKFNVHLILEIKVI